MRQKTTTITALFLVMFLVACSQPETEEKPAAAAPPPGAYEADVIRRGVRWQDGTPPTPEDVAFPLDYQQDYYRRQYGLDRPLAQQYAASLAALAAMENE